MLKFVVTLILVSLAASTIIETIHSSIAERFKEILITKINKEKFKYFINCDFCLSVRVAPLVFLVFGLPYILFPCIYTELLYSCLVCMAAPIAVYKILK